ncbi:MAG: permease [Tistlia sp.]
MSEQTLRTPSPLWDRLRRLGRERVWLASAGLLLLLALVVPRQALESLTFTLGSLWSIAPFLLLSVVSAAWLKAAGADRLIARVVGLSPGLALLAGAALGALSPFCSCGVVPIVAALLAVGVPLPAVMAFWIASPLMDPEMFLLMLPIVGLEFTLAKTAAAVAMGLLAGTTVWLLQGRGLLAAPLKTLPGGCGGCGGPKLPTGETRWAVWREAPRRALFGAEAVAAGGFLLKWLSLAFLLESLMVAWLPQELVADTLGGEGPWTILLAGLVGVPAYLNGYAAVPLIDRLMSDGMAPGAALTFLLAGGASSVPAAMAVWALVRRPVFGLYLGLALAGSVAAGLLFQTVAG